MSAGHTVALVDDDDAVLDSLKFLLELDGYTVVTCHSALAFLDDRATEPACLIVDHRMPSITGLELIARLRDEGRNVPALLATGASSPAILAQASRLGIEVLEKPPDENAVLRFINMHV